MEIFKRHKNILFKIMTRVLNESILNGKVLSKEQLRDVFEKNGYYDPTDVAIKQIIGDLTAESEQGTAALGLLDRENGGYKASLPGSVPCRLSVDELEWLKSMLADYRIAVFLSAGTMLKLSEALLDVQPFYTEGDVQYNRNVSEQNYDDEGMASHFMTAMESIGASRIVKLESASRDGTRHSSCVLPLCIDYNCLNDMFQLIIYLPEERRKIAVNMDSIISIEGTGIVFGGSVDVNAGIKTVTVEISNRKNSYTQCFQIFSDYIKRVEYNKERGIYRIEIDYYTFDERDVFKNLMSLGQACKIVSPSCLAEQVKTRIVRAKLLREKMEESYRPPAEAQA
jgi:hypothetical protein